jgi:hypothetical protein
LVNSSQWRNINSLSSDGTSGSDSGRIFSGSTLDNCLEQNFEWVFAGKEVDDFKSLLENSNSQLLFTILSMISNHDLVTESFSDWALDFLESLLLILASSVWDVHLGLGCLY